MGKRAKSALSPVVNDTLFKKGSTNSPLLGNVHKSTSEENLNALRSKGRGKRGLGVNSSRSPSPLLGHNRALSIDSSQHSEVVKLTPLADVTPALNKIDDNSTKNRKN